MLDVELIPIGRILFLGQCAQAEVGSKVVAGPREPPSWLMSHWCRSNPGGESHLLQLCTQPRQERGKRKRGREKKAYGTNRNVEYMAEWVKPVKCN